MRIKTDFGFTLIELIVVIAIVGIMASAVMAVLDPFTQIKKARDARVKSDLAQIQKALETYYQDKGFYPISCGAYTIQDTIGGIPTCISWGNAWTPYMNIIPKDPTPAHNYVYYRLDGQTYYLYANLGRGEKDSQACTDITKKDTDCPNVPLRNGTLCGAKCDFGVTSPNTTP